MVSALDSRGSGPGSSFSWELSIMFYGKALYSDSAFLHPGVQMGATAENPIQGGVEILFSLFMLQKPGRALL